MKITDIAMEENDSRPVIIKEDTEENRKIAAKSWEETILLAKELESKYENK